MVCVRVCVRGGKGRLTYHVSVVFGIPSPEKIQGIHNLMVGRYNTPGNLCNLRRKEPT